MRKQIAYVLGIALVLASAAFAFIMFNNSSAPGNLSQKTSSKSASGTTDALTSDSAASSDGLVTSAGTVASDGTSNDIKQNGKSTLLIYMIGSDLESRSGAGTDDLEEIEKSGIDTSKANVVIYAGGSPRWHNDLTSKENNTILQLGKKGFEKVTAMDSSSMGTSDSLLEFLNYGYQNYPSHSYSLIMWDHGNGPVIGYGKDMLFDNDSLTLAEMKTALSKSPFNGDNKLAWVGFDACLMSSAELACIWADHADYMIASQEIEPSFGWNYSVLKDFGVKDTKSFSSKLIDDYLSACESYYDEKGYENRDTTLSCMNLAYAMQLEDAINSVFARASQDVGSNYNTLVQKRVATRALGRASTGSEYDLIDLNDMALQLESIYPLESKQLAEVLNQMIVKNGTNAQGCCGMSLYYPFYNKYYFEDSWGQVYASLGIFPDYSNYLTAYQNIWLKSDKLDSYTKSNVPQKVSDAPNRSSAVAGTYKLQLTSDQNESYADAKFYILKHVAGEMYHPVISSENVVWQDGALYAVFSGNAIYVKDNFNHRYLPVSTENDTVGNISRYTINSRGESRPEYENLDFHVSLDNSADEVSISAILPRNNSQDEMILAGGKQKEYRLTDWSSYWFYYNKYGYLTRYPGGAIKPIDQWYRRGTLSYCDLPVQNGIKFVYEPLENDKYYFIFEITDTQGSKYCSELLLIDGQEYTENPTYFNEDINIDWNQGEKTEILSCDGVTLNLKKSYDSTNAPSYVMEVINDNDFSVIARFDSIICNGDAYAGSFYANVPAKSVGISYDVIPTKINYALGAITDISTLEGSITISDNVEYARLLLNQNVKINISGDAKLKNMSDHYKALEKTGAYLGALADEQLLYKDDEVCVTLLYFGKNNMYSNPGIICVENLTNEYRNVDIDAYCINGITIDVYDSYYPPPNSKEIRLLGSFQSNLPQNKINQIENISAHISVYDSSSVIDYPIKTQWVPIKLKESSKAAVYPESGNIIFSQNNIFMHLNEYKLENEMPTWYVTVVNNSDNDIAFLNTDNILIDGKVGAHQKSTVAIKFYGEDTKDLLNGEKLSLPIQIMDFYSSKVLYECEKPVELYAVEAEKEKIKVNWKNGDSVKLIEQNGITLYLKKLEEDKSEFYYNEETGEFVILRDYTDTVYSLEVHNSNSFPVNFDLQNIILNENVIYAQSLSLYEVEPGMSKSRTLSLHNEAIVGAFSEIYSLEFDLSAQNSSIYKDYLVEKQNIKVSMSDETKLNLLELGSYAPLTVEPYMDALAQEQVLLEKDEFRITLLYFGDSNTNSRGYICFENYSSEDLQFNISSVGINSVSDSANVSATVLPDCKSYKPLNIYPQYLGITSIESLSLFVSVTKVNSDKKMTAWVPVVLKEKGESTDFAEGENVVFNKAGVRIVLDSVQKAKDGNYYKWNVTVINDNDYGVKLSNNREFGNAVFNSGQIGPGLRSSEIIYHSDKLDLDKIDLKVIIYDFYGNEKLFSDAEPITLYAGNEDKLHLIN